ncbi:hypothetical protein [Bacillus pumilus]|nr:hypothetical protein [Bacillus pumilus]
MRIEEVEKVVEFAGDAVEVKDEGEVWVRMVWNEEIDEINKE